jgi:Bifunctional DNA primase/polymerase, N-terminal
VTERPLDAALRYARWGWAVFPCHEPSHGHCSCGHADCSSPAKHPRTRRGLHDATTDPDHLIDWWRRWPSANVGVRTGSASGLVILDIDRRPGGVVSLTRLEQTHGELPPTAMVETGRGRHYWFTHPGGTVPNSAGRLGPGVDLRGDGGYIIAPPSSHISGRRYRWAAPHPIAVLPSWILDLTREPARPVHEPAGRTPRTPGDIGRWANAALTAELDRVQSSVPGSRNHVLNRAAFALGQLVGSGHLVGDDVREALHNAGISCGLTSREVRATVASGLQAGISRPRHPRTLDIYPT